MCSDLSKYDKSELVKSAQKCMKLIKSYSEKLEVQMQKLVEAVEDSDKEFVEKVLDEDCQQVLEVENCSIELEHFIENVKEIQQKESKDTKTKDLNTERLIQVQEQMQQMMDAQLKQQQGFLEREEQKEQKDKNSVRLPKIELSSFNGNKLKWIEFWDAYECTVHENKKLSNIEKFSYLLSKLFGEAKCAVAGIALSNDNYQVAIDILKQRFGNKQDVIDLHYKELMNIPSPTSKVQSLRSFLDASEKHFRSLEVLEENTNQHVFVSMIRSKMPEDVLRQLEFRKGSKTEWTLEVLREQLREYVSACEKSEKKVDEYKEDRKGKVSFDKKIQRSPHFTNQRSQQFRNRMFAPQSSAESLLTNEKSKHDSSRRYASLCRYCEKRHWSDECEKYGTIEERKRRIKGSCFRCLKEGHVASECKANKSCVYCGEYNVHHRSLCPKKFKFRGKREASSVSLSDDVNEELIKEAVSEENVLISPGEMVLMQTAQTEVKNPRNERCADVRVLLDCGSQRTYITQKLADQLGLKKEKEEEIKLVTFGSKNTKVIKTALTTLDVKLNNGDYLKMSASIVPVISGNILRKQLDLSSTGELCHLLKSIDLADTIPIENEYSTIELLIGNDFYLDIILSQKIEIQAGLYLLGSKLGWLLTGRTSEVTDVKTDTNMLILTYGTNITNTSVFQSVDCSVPTKPDLEDFWNTESIGVVDKPDESDDEHAMKNFKETLKFENKRYQVTWPWKDDTPELPVNRELAYGRLKSCIRKLRSKPELLNKYNSVIQEQLNNGVIEPVKDSIGDVKIHYIPHHAVITPQKTTTKLRVVYDASSKCRPEYKSLNECLNRGPVMLHDLCGLLMRFRLNRIAITADIEKAFLQIGLQPSERNVTRFLWLKSCDIPTLEQNNIQEYRFCRVPFGVISSPFLLGATVETHLDKYNTDVANKLKHDIYVDNVITGTDTEPEAVDLYHSAKLIFEDASRNLRQWMSNSNTVNQLIPVQDRAETRESSVLGHGWNCQTDTLTIKRPKIQNNNEPITKRSVLKVIASVFDPLGLFSPVLVRGKLLLQELWSRKCEWDDPVEDEKLKEKWSKISDDINQIAEYTIPRGIAIDSSKNVTYNLLCFCDASSTSYATAVYLRQRYGSVVSSDLVFSKCRIAPVKGMTIPRLELMAVLIGVRCVKFVSDQLKLQIDSVSLWTDSQCVLGWLNTDKTLPTFVKNRVEEIKRHDGIEVFYVNTKENPVDVATRGINLKALHENTLWWHGPSWVKDEINTSSLTKNSEIVSDSQNQPEREKQHDTNVLSTSELKKDLILQRTQRMLHLT